MGFPSVFLPFVRRESHSNLNTIFWGNNSRGEDLCKPYMNYPPALLCTNAYIQHLCIERGVGTPLGLWVIFSLTLPLFLCSPLTVSLLMCKLGMSSGSGGWSLFEMCRFSTWVSWPFLFCVGVFWMECGPSLVAWAWLLVCMAGILCLCVIWVTVLMDLFCGGMGITLQIVWRHCFWFPWNGFV